MSNKKKFVQTQYNLTADSYHHRYQEIQLAKYRQISELIEISKSPVLELGIGTGIGIMYLPSKIQIIGIDLSIACLKVIKKNHDSNTIHIVNGDIDNLPFRSKRFPQILAVTVLQNLSSIDHVLEESLRVIKKPYNLMFSILKKRLPNLFEQEIKMLFRESVIFKHRNGEDLLYHIQEK